MNYLKIITLTLLIFNLISCGLLSSKDPQNCEEATLKTRQDLCNNETAIYREFQELYSEKQFSITGFTLNEQNNFEILKKMKIGIVEFIKTYNLCKQYAGSPYTYCINDGNSMISISKYNYTSTYRLNWNTKMSKKNNIYELKITTDSIRCSKDTICNTLQFNKSEKWIISIIDDNNLELSNDLGTVKINLLKI